MANAPQPGPEPEKGTGQIGTELPPETEPGFDTAGTSGAGSAPGEETLQDIAYDERLDRAEAGLD